MHSESSHFRSFPTNCKIFSLSTSLPPTLFLGEVSEWMKVDREKKKIYSCSISLCRLAHSFYLYTSYIYRISYLFYTYLSFILHSLSFSRLGLWFWFLLEAIHLNWMKFDRYSLVDMYCINRRNSICYIRTNLISIENVYFENFQIVNVELNRGWNSRLGFSLRNEPNTDQTYIRAIYPESVAAKDGRLKVGDQILAVSILLLLCVR